MNQPETCIMPESAISGRADINPAICQMQWFTVGWMTVEVVVALVAAVRAHSVALAAFGGDSAIELLSAATVLWRFRSTSKTAEATSTKITGWLLIALAVFIAADSSYTLIATEAKPKPSSLGIALLVAAAVVMPWLAHRKRKLAATANSVSLRSDATQSSICGYMAWIALAGLLLNVFAHLGWADPVAALVLVPIVIKEAKETLEGRE